MTRRITRIERLAQKEEKTVIKRIVYLSIISIILAVFLFTLGIPLLGKFADLLDTVFISDNTQVSIDKSVPQPPRIDSLPSATNSAKLIVTGFSEEETIVEVYQNLEKIGQTETKDGKFSFEDLNLKNGENIISAKAVKQTDGESDFSQTKTVTYDREDPKLEIESPSEGQSFSQNNRIRVSGRSDKDAQVYANGFLASVDFEGNFEVFVPVVEGESIIEIKAVDEAGNTKIETRKVNFKK